MAFAGLWDAWKEPKASVQAVDTWLQSFSIITTEANELMSTIHTRMPVILAERDWTRWLDRDPEARPPIDLLRPCFAEDSKALAGSTEHLLVEAHGAFKLKAAQCVEVPKWIECG